MNHGHYHRRSHQLWGTCSGTARESFFTELIATGTTVTSQVYCEMLNKLRRLIPKKRRGMLTKGVALMHNTRPHLHNMRPHTASGTNDLLKLFNWEIFDHPLQSGPDAKRLPSLHQDERSGWLPSASTPTKSSWMESTNRCIIWRHRSLTRDYKN